MRIQGLLRPVFEDIEIPAPAIGQRTDGARTVVSGMRSSEAPWQHEMNESKSKSGAQQSPTSVEARYGTLDVKWTWRRISSQDALRVICQICLDVCKCRCPPRSRLVFAMPIVLCTLMWGQRP